MRELIPIIISLIVPVIEAYFDAKKFKVKHVPSAIIRTVLALGISLFMGYVSYYYIFLFMCILLNIYWIVFDLAYNKFRGVNIWYIGNTSFIDKNIQKILGKDGSTFLVLKCLFLMLFLTAYSL